MSKKPSRWHEWGQRTIWKDGHAVDSVPDWILIRTNRNIPTTKTVQIKNNIYCAYCGERALTIQGNFEEYNYRSTAVTGYTCDCSGARAEREYIFEKSEIEKEFALLMQKSLSDLQAKYVPAMKVNLEKLLQLKALSDSSLAKISLNEVFDVTDGKMQ